MSLDHPLTAPMEVSAAKPLHTPRPTRFQTARAGRFRVYVDPDTPFWFVPNETAHGVLDLHRSGVSEAALVEWLAARTAEPAPMGAGAIRRLFRAVCRGDAAPYQGRHIKKLVGLSELWLHVTDSCNCACRHCLFSGNSSRGRRLGVQQARELIASAERLGCRLVCITGGEPLTHPHLTELIRGTLDLEAMSVVVLTNGLLVPQRLRELRDLDRGRLHFQVSLDGPESLHDNLRGKGGFPAATKALRLLVDAGIPCTISMAVNSANVSAMAEVVGFARKLGVPTVHYMWHFRRGMGTVMDILPLQILIRNFRHAAQEALTAGVTIDNLEAMRAQVFSHPGTRFDLSNAGWESLAVGPDGNVFPSPATVDLDGLRAGHISEGLEAVWRTSPTLDRVRRATLLDVPAMAADPWRFVIGGGDPDHCRHRPHMQEAGGLLGDDPYRPLYRDMALMLIEQEAELLPEPSRCGLILRMGDVTTECPSGEEVNFTHCNCLLSLGDGSTRGLVREFYADRAEARDEVILNPVAYDEEEMRFIPEQARARMYGCGSPVADANLRAGEVLVDLGCGTGVECFLAARQVGPGGRAVGIDMTDRMLEIARRAQEHVHRELGCANTEFLKAHLEEIPLRDNCADVVISNCVINLSPRTRRVFGEILRVLKPGGRLVISDVVAETEPPLRIRADHQLMGECIGGALVQEYLFSMLADLGFVSSAIVKRFPYRTVQGHPFYSLTFRASKPGSVHETVLLYPGPFESVTLETGTQLPKGVPVRVDLPVGLDEEALARAGVFVLDPSDGAITNVEAASSCACFLPPAPVEAAPQTGCLECGAALQYLRDPAPMVCVRCGKTVVSHAVCEAGHFVCDECHVQDARGLIRRICTTTAKTDMLSLLAEIRSHGVIPLHGPEHHAIVPGVILATYRNLGGNITEKQILDGIERGASIPGGSCAFMGCCGAASGAGVAVAIIFGANPLTPEPRQAVQHVVQQILARISDTEAARCCQRESVAALQVLAELSAELLPVKLAAEQVPVCTQFTRNHECIGRECRLHPVGRRTAKPPRHEET
ncbi:MAG: DUF5714 domain-containing protein [Thermodesulfobacteriota bacterium]